MRVREFSALWANRAGLRLTGSENHGAGNAATGARSRRKTLWDFEIWRRSGGVVADGDRGVKKGGIVLDTA